MPLRGLLLACGVIASLLYVGIDVIAAIRYPEYHSFTSQAISELMANGAPTERLVDPPFLLYDALMMAFGVGVWLSGHGKRAHIVASSLFVFAAIGLTGPTVFEMNVRGTGGDPTADILHIVVTGVLVLVILGTVGFGASMRGQAFRLYSFATLLIMLVFGILTSVSSRGVATGEPTPWFGLTERINIGAFLLWVAVLAISLLRSERTADASAQGFPGGGRLMAR